MNVLLNYTTKCNCCCHNFTISTAKDKAEKVVDILMTDANPGKRKGPHMVTPPKKKQRQSEDIEVYIYT